MSENKAKLRQALREAARQEFEHIPHEESAVDHTFSQSFENRMDVLLKPHEKQRKHSFIQHAACIFLVFVMFLGCAMSVEAIRAPVLQFLSQYEFLYVSTHGYSGEKMTDENGMPYIVYSGGELHLPYRIVTNRTFQSAEIGVFVFIDGQPQPYKTADSDSYQYMHRFSSTFSGIIQDELIFTPVTGRAGETLRISVLCLVSPDEYLSPDGIGQPSWDWTTAYNIRLQYQATPPEPEPIAVMERTDGFTVREEEAGVLTNSWSEAELEEQIGFRLYVNDAYQDTITQVDASEPLRLRLVLWGSDTDAYKAVFYVNHQPITVKPENRITVRNQAGYKTIIETEVDLSDLRGEVIVYAMISGTENGVMTENDFGYTVSTRYFIFTCG